MDDIENTIHWSATDVAPDCISKFCDEMDPNFNFSYTEIFANFGHQINGTFESEFYEDVGRINYLTFRDKKDKLAFLIRYA